MTIQFQIRAEAGKPEQRTFRGQDHTVVPLVALVEGVVKGANANNPEFVSAEALERSVVGWNGRPVVIDHPKVNGQYVSANHPDVLETELVGHVFNSKVEDGKLKMEAWIPNESTGDKRIDKTLKKVNKGDIVELSTGFYADVVSAAGRFNDEDFDNIIENILPDHLAILSQGKGACSVEDGCGVNRVNLRVNLDEDCECKGDKPILESLKEWLGLKTNLTHSDIEFAVSNKLRKEITEEFFWLRAVEGNMAIYVTPNGLFRRAFKFSDDGKVELVGEAEEVRPETTFVPLEAKKEVDNRMAEKTGTVTKVNDLIANEATAFTEDDRKWLEGLEETQLDKLAPVARANEEEEEEEEEQEEVTPPTFDQLLANAAPETRESLQYGQRLYEQERSGMIALITKNPNNKFTEEKLKSFDFETLQELAALAGADYSGRGAPRANKVENDNDIPPPPKVFDENYGKETVNGGR